MTYQEKYDFICNKINEKHYDEWKYNNRNAFYLELTDTENDKLIAWMHIPTQADEHNYTDYLPAICIDGNFFVVEAISCIFDKLYETHILSSKTENKCPIDEIYKKLSK